MVTVKSVFEWDSKLPPAELAKALREIASALDPVKVSAPSLAAAEVSAPKRGRPPKAQAPSTSNDVEEKDHIDMGDLLGESQDELGLEPQPTWDELLAAFSNFCKKNPRAKAVEVLAKFKAKSVKDLKPEQYAAVIAHL